MFSRDGIIGKSLLSIIMMAGILFPVSLFGFISAFIILCLIEFVIKEIKKTKN